ncbi:ERV/ALR sulfhydryl oxidase domain-containing protein [Crassisporium funariophilum]|nr:ERV/ALR sulfhydryl oxidase domain-containing protein [Crassisporium funariophilum]
MAVGDMPATSQKPSQAKGVPPGMVMGPDGKPCKICTAFRSWQPRTSNNIEADSNRNTKGRPSASNTHPAQKQQQNRNAAASSMAAFAAGAGAAFAPSSPSNSTTAAVSANDASTQRGDEPPPGCPPDVEQLGRATWTFLHTTAAYYPEKPTPNQRANMLMLLRSLPVLYPCTWCADDFGKDIERNAPDVSGRGALSRWLCERHNEVNEKLGKGTFDCAKVDERWKDGPPDGSCD